MAVNFSTVFGYHPSSGSSEHSKLKEVKDELKKLNIIGYIPLVGGQIAAVLRIAKSAQKINQDGVDSYAVGMFVRAGGEFLGLGLLMGLIDLIVTLGRKLSNNEEGSTYVKTQ